jgi:hypothetical protein
MLCAAIQRLSSKSEEGGSHHEGFKKRGGEGERDELEINRAIGEEKTKKAGKKTWVINGKVKNGMDEEKVASGEATLYSGSRVLKRASRKKHFDEVIAH